ncbi:MAG: hypothetical protein AAF560_24560 [Acidobacteriota bacterium]
MAQFKAFSPRVEVLGEVVLSFVNVMGAFKRIALGILEENGIVDPQPDQWYSQQAWLDSFRKIAEQVGPNTLYQIGRQIPQQHFFPPGVDSIEDVLANLDEAYRMAHRGGEVGHYRFQVIGMRSGKMTCDNPYPCDFDRGIIQALVERFEPQGSLVDVRHEDNAPCKKSGADSCSYTITW